MAHTKPPINAERAARALSQFKDMMRKNPGVFTTSLRDALQLAVIRLAVRGRNPTKFERQFVATASYGLERGFGAEHKAHLLQPHRIPPAPGSFAG